MLSSKDLARRQLPRPRELRQREIIYLLAEFNYDGTELHLEAVTAAVLLLGHARPFQEPIVAAGPFVINTEAEIQEAYRDYRAGKFGKW